MPAPFSKFSGKICVSFCLNTGKRFFLEVLFSSQQKGFLKNGTTKDFQNNPLLERWACFYVTISETFVHFQYFSFETDFLENKKKLKKLEFSLLAERTKIENASFPY